MRAFYLIPVLIFLCFIAKAQTSKFGQIDIADLKLSSCSFDKSADAMVLFDIGRIVSSDRYGVTMTRHERIKIFNERGLAAADLKINYLADSRFGAIQDLEAITYNLLDDKVEKVLIDKKQIYVQKIDKVTRQYVIPFPKVKAGSVIEFRYKWTTIFANNYPAWKFQNTLPTKYSEFDVIFRMLGVLNPITNVNRPFVKDSTYQTKDNIRHIWAMQDVPEYKLEPYMHSVEENMQYVSFRRPRQPYSWEMVVKDIMDDDDFGKQLNQPLANEAELIKKAGLIKSDLGKVEFLFNTVKNTIKWNEKETWYTDAGIKKAWLKKSGNSAEVNLILFHLLKAAGLSPLLAVVGSRDFAEIKLDDPGYSKLSKTVLQVPLDSIRYLTLDATSRYNTYNLTPFELLGQNMLLIDPVTGDNNIVQLQSHYQSEEVTLINARIDAEGKVVGNTQQSSSFYKKIDKMKQFDDGGEKSYIDGIKAGNNDIVISGFKRSGMDVDTLPLREDFDFKISPANVDGNYIYLNLNLFTGIGINPFLSEERLSDIDYIYLNKFNINGQYKLPKGYKIDALLKEISLTMPDKSIVFNRIVGELNGDLAVHYLISFKKVKFNREEYPALRDFYRKMFELLNEQIVLKKVS